MQFFFAKIYIWAKKQVCNQKKRIKKFLQQIWVFAYEKMDIIQFSFWNLYNKQFFTKIKIMLLRVRKHSFKKNFFKTHVNSYRNLVINLKICFFFSVENACHKIFLCENIMRSILLNKIKIMFLLSRKIQRMEIEQKYFSKNL